MRASRGIAVGGVLVALVAASCSTTATTSAPSTSGAPAAGGSSSTVSNGGTSSTAAGGTGTTVGAASDRVFPGDEWATADPIENGFDPTKWAPLLDQAEKAMSNCVLITRHGKVVGEWYWQGKDETSAQEVFSATKSFSSTLVGMAQADGKLKITDKASDYITAWKGTPSEAVTVQDLLSNDSGRHYDFDTDYIKMAAAAADKTQFAIDLAQDQPPGEVWEYNNSAIQTLDRVLQESLGQSPSDYAEDRLFGPIGMDHSTMKKDPSGNTLTFMGLDSTCQDMARFGYLFLNEGNWDGEQIVPADWVAEATRPSQKLNEAYGYLWWLNAKGHGMSAAQATVGAPDTGEVTQMVKGASDQAFFALGLGGQIIGVFPEEDVVVVRLGPARPPAGGPSFDVGDVAKFVTETLEP